MANVLQKKYQLLEYLLRYVISFFFSLAESKKKKFAVAFIFLEFPLLYIRCRLAKVTKFLVPLQKNINKQTI